MEKVIGVMVFVGLSLSMLTVGIAIHFILKFW
jgi:hypothetical protein